MPSQGTGQLRRPPVPSNQKGRFGSTVVSAYVEGLTNTEQLTQQVDIEIFNNIVQSSARWACRLMLDLITALNQGAESTQHWSRTNIYNSTPGLTFGFEATNFPSSREFNMDADSVDSEIMDQDTVRNSNKFALLHLPPCEGTEYSLLMLAINKNSHIATAAAELLFGMQK